MAVIVEMKSNDWIRKFERLVIRCARYKKGVIKDDVSFSGFKFYWVHRRSLH